MQRLIFVWTLVAAAIVAHQVFLGVKGLPVETDLLALLPPDRRDEAADRVLAHLSQQASKSVVVLISATSLETALEAAKIFDAAIDPERLKKIPAPSFEHGLPEELAPWRDYLLTDAQQKRLTEASPEQLTERAMLQLTQPVGPRFGEFREDPLQLYGEYLRERAQLSRLRPNSGFLVMEDEQRRSVLLRYQVASEAFSFDGTAHLQQALEIARAKVTAAEVEVLSAGVPLFAEAAAVQANSEVSTVGVGSLLAILAVMWLAFRSPRPIVLVVLSVGMGVAAGLSACVVIFGKVHLMTLVFGASLVGVAEDYGIHYFASRQAQPKRDPRELLNHLAPGLFLALLTSMAGYVMLALAPFPGLRQVAVFSSVGLAAAFLTVLAWFPVFDRRTVKSTRFSTIWAGTRAKWPLLKGARLVLAVTVAGVVTGVGFSRLHASDDVRGLQASPPALIAAQRTVAERVGLPSPAQFFLVRGANEAERLEHEEALRRELEALVPSGILKGYAASSTWVPSPSRQLANQALSTRTRSSVLTALRDELEDSRPIVSEALPLTIADAMKTQLGDLLGPLWLDDVSVVMLQNPTIPGLETLAGLERLPGVRFVDRTGELSALMRTWRVGMTELLAVGYAVIFAALFWRFRGKAWRALLPTAVSSGLALATVGFMGEPLTLFHVLALWLLLGMGVDYGIFLIEHPSDSGEAWLAVGLGAVSTLLSFGLLGVSSTPAIHAFGTTLGVGVTLVWLLSPLTAPFEPAKPEADPSAH